MNQIITATPTAKATQAPSMDDKANSIIEQIEGLVESLWQTNVFDLPDELALELTENVEAWTKQGYLLFPLCKD